MELLVKAQGLFGHLDGMATKLVEPTTTGAMAQMPEQVSTRERYPKELSQYLQEQAIFFQQIMSTIPDSLYLKIKEKSTIKEAWDVLHCPDMDLTLVSIGKITNAGYQDIFKGPACRICDSKDRIISQINARNGLEHFTLPHILPEDS